MILYDHFFNRHTTKFTSMTYFQKNEHAIRSDTLLTFSSYPDLGDVSILNKLNNLT